MRDVAEQIASLQAEVERLRTQDTPVPPLISPFLALPGLRGLWPMSVIDSNGDAYDISGHGHHLSYNGNPTYNFVNEVPYLDLDGTGDYLSRADEADLDILGNESYVASAAQGLTFGGWFWFDSLASNVNLMAKWSGTPGLGRAYRLRYSNASANISATVSTDGTATQSASLSFSTASAWSYVIARFVPSTSVDIWINRIKASDTTGIPATIANVTGGLGVGADDTGGGLLDGRVSICFLSAMALADAMIEAIFDQSRVFYGV